MHSRLTCMETTENTRGNDKESCYQTINSGNLTTKGTYKQDDKQKTEHRTEAKYNHENINFPHDIVSSSLQTNGWNSLQFCSYEQLTARREIN